MFYKIVFYRKNIFDELERVKTERAEFASYDAAPFFYMLIAGAVVSFIAEVHR